MKKLRIASLTILITIITLLSISCLTDDPLKIPFQSYAPDNLGDGWDISNPANEGIDEEELKDLYRRVHDNDNYWQIRSLLVFRNNKLVAESYMKDNKDRTSLHPIWSCTKQVIGILTGIAVDKGYFSIDDTISDHLHQVSNYHGKDAITIENLLMMKSGIDYNNDGFNGEDTKLARGEPSNSLDFILGLGMHSPVGTQYRYKNSDPHIISAVIQEKAGKTTRDWAQEVLFGKIGITRLEWRTYKDGITLGGFGILTTPREMGKIGQLVSNGGMWGNEQVVSKTWIAEMIKPATSDAATGVSGISFGYQWWIDTARNVFIMWGHGGQYVIINADKNLVIAITSERHTEGSHNLSVHTALSIYDAINGIAL